MQDARRRNHTAGAAIRHSTRKDYNHDDSNSARPDHGRDHGVRVQGRRRTRRRDGGAARVHRRPHGPLQDAGQRRPDDVEELAAKTGLQERYLREWAAAMAASGFIDYDPADQTFACPPAKAAVLADEDSPVFVGGFAQMLPDHYAVIPGIMKAFREGGGVPYSSYTNDTFQGTERFFRPGYINFLVQEWMPAIGFDRAPDAGRQGRRRRLRPRPGDLHAGAARSRSRRSSASTTTARASRRRRRTPRTQGVAGNTTWEVRGSTELPQTGDFDLDHDARLAARHGRPARRRQVDLRRAQAGRRLVHRRAEHVGQARGEHQPGRPRVLLGEHAAVHDGVARARRRGLRRRHGSGEDPARWPKKRASRSSRSCRSRTRSTSTSWRRSSRTAPPDERGARRRAPLVVLLRRVDLGVSYDGSRTIVARASSATPSANSMRGRQRPVAISFDTSRHERRISPRGGRCSMRAVAAERREHRLARPR